MYVACWRLPAVACVVICMLNVRAAAQYHCENQEKQQKLGMATEILPSNSRALAHGSAVYPARTPLCMNILMNE